MPNFDLKENDDGTFTMILLLLFLLASCSSAPHSQPASKPIQWDEPQSPAPATKAGGALLHEADEPPTETEKHEYVKNKLGQAQDELNRALKKGR